MANVFASKNFIRTITFTFPVKIRCGERQGFFDGEIGNILK
jgi:hypothetical protein